MFLVVYFNGDNTWTVLNGHKLEVHYPEKGVFIGSILTTKNSAKQAESWGTRNFKGDQAAIFKVTKNYYRILFNLRRSLYIFLIHDNFLIVVYFYLV
jgi:hypothetical protein